jgi:hypothetical protein
MTAKIDMDVLRELFLKLYEGLKRIFERIKEFVKDAAAIYDECSKRKTVIADTRSGWNVIKDTRRRSQVLMNKPRNLVKKVIR